MTKTRNRSWTNRDVWERDLGFDKRDFPYSKKGYSLKQTAKNALAVLLITMAMLWLIDQLAQDLPRILL